MAKPSWKPKPGQIDFSKARWAPVINCVVRHRGELLLLKRNKALRFYPGYWNGISGFLDDKKSLVEKVKEELKEEAGISPRSITKIRVGEVFDQDEPRYGKTWIVHPVLVDVKTNKVKIDWESRDYRWVSAREAATLRLLPGFDGVLRKLSKWL